MSNRIAARDVLRSIAASVRNDVRAAAGDDKALQTHERAALLPLAAAAAAAIDDNDLPVSDVVDKALSLTAGVWARHNQASGSGKPFLSQAELRAIKNDDPVVGAATDAAVARVRARSALPLSEAQARAKSRDGIVAALKAGRMNDADWTRYFPQTWPENVARGIDRGLDAFVDPAGDTEVVDEADAFVFAGRGPYDLYTEVEVEKRGGRIRRVLIEID